MSENNRTELLESLSAIADGEATEFELRRILREEDNSELVKEKWAEYHRVGSLLRSEPTTGYVDISAVVMGAVEAEPKPNSAARFFKPLGQIAVAASVAAVALFGVQQYQFAQMEPTAESSVAETQPLESSDALEFTAPIGFDQPQTSLVSTNPEVSNISKEVPLEIPFDQRALYEHVNESILEHSENAAEATQDVYPLLRVLTEE